MRNIFFTSVVLFSTAAVCFGQVKHISVNPSKTFQVIDNFAASDAWSGNFVGKYWSDTAKQQIAEWLFSTEYDATGSPKGIGLSLWRVNVGAGTLEQADADIMPLQRRAESFLTVDGKGYDWGKCLGQQYFMEQAVKFGCNNFLLFSNSPLVQYTLNGKGWSSHIDAANIQPDSYDKYAAYLTDVASYYQGKGWNVSYISPINEPQVDWTSPRQEGSPWKKSEMKKMYVALDRALSGNKELANVEILVGEAASLKYLYEADSNLRKRFGGEEAPDEQVKAFFDVNSPYYIGDLKHVPRLIAGHTYHNHTKNNEMREVRSKAGKAFEQYDVDFHQTEWCILHYAPPMDGFETDWQKEDKKDIQVGLLIGRLIYSDMVDANAKAWGYWKGMELNGDYALISLLAKEGNIFNGGTVSSNKILWALGNYSFFIRPGYTRVETEGANDLDTLVATAYLAPDHSCIVVVFVNSGYNQENIELQLPKTYNEKVKTTTVYRTDDRIELARVYHTDKRNPTLSITPRSLTTVVLELNP